MRFLAFVSTFLLLLAISACGKIWGGINFFSQPSIPCTGTLGAQWTWITGSNIVNFGGTYGIQGVGSTLNIPGARSSVSGNFWADASGNLWLFGGNGCAGGCGNKLNDLWEYSPGNGQWTWVQGTNLANDGGTFGVQGTGSTLNFPEAGHGGFAFYNLNTIWSFAGGGGNGYSDLWSYTPGNSQWTWVSGPSTTNQMPTYGVQGTGSTLNIPGARQGQAMWVDSTGMVWIFGGTANDNAGNYGIINDLWKYNPGNTQWTWVAGSNTRWAASVYGTQGVGSTLNYPGARSGSSVWQDSSGNIWIFGGQAVVGGLIRNTNELWKYNPSNSQWTWVSGYQVGDTAGIYGTLGVGSVSNTPGTRQDMVSWMDTSGNFWIYGGTGTDITPANGAMSDLWEFNPNNIKWTWVWGSQTNNQTGIYGTQKVTSSSNAPGSRVASFAWPINSTNIWVFGGGGYDSVGANGSLNDLWKLQITCTP